MMKTPALMWGLAASMILVGCREPNAPPPPPKAAEAAAHAAAVALPAGGPGAGDELGASVLQGIDVALASEQSYCNIESVDWNLFGAGPRSVQPGQTIRGWLGHVSQGSVQSPLLLVLNDGGVVAGIRLQLSNPREDVVNAHGGRPDLRNAGFEALLPAAPAGAYRLLLHYTFDGKAYRCDNGRQIVFP